MGREDQVTAGQEGGAGCGDRRKSEQVDNDNEIVWRSGSERQTDFPYKQPITAELTARSRRVNEHILRILKKKVLIHFHKKNISKAQNAP